MLNQTRHQHLVLDAEVSAETYTPPTLVINVFLLSEPTPMSFLRAGAETDTPLSFSTIVSRDLDRMDRMV